MGCWTMAMAMRRGSGGMGKKMDSMNEANASMAIAHSVSANPRSQSERSWSSSLRLSIRFVMGWWFSFVSMNFGGRLGFGVHLGGGGSRIVDLWVLCIHSHRALSHHLVSILPSSARAIRNSANDSLLDFLRLHGLQSRV